MSSQSNQNISPLVLAVSYLYRSGGVLLVIFGNIGCMLNIAIFTRKTLRKNPCSIYFIARNIFDFLFINSILLAYTLEVGFGIHYTTTSAILCALNYYTSISSNALSSFCLISASVDRVLVTSSHALTRQRSNLRTSYICVIIGTIFWLLFHSPTLILTNITQLDQHTHACFYQIGPYLTFLSYYSMIKESGSILLLIIFGVWAVKNIRRIRHVVIPSGSQPSGTAPTAAQHTLQAKDRQFVYMVLIDIVLYIICCSTAAIYLTYQYVTQYQEKSIEHLQLDLFLKYVTEVVLHIPFCLSCYTNLLVSKAYRNAMRNLFSRQ